MRTVDRDLDRILALLRNRIRERGFTQLEVQQALGWGRSYVSQLVTKQKSLRVEHVLLILNVISVKPEDFFGEIYQFGKFSEARPRRRGERGCRAAPSLPDADVLADLRRVRGLLEGVVTVLTQKQLITDDDLESRPPVAGESDEMLHPEGKSQRPDGPRRPLPG